jgi:hypothetical protein
MAVPENTRGFRDIGTCGARSLASNLELLANPIAPGVFSNTATARDRRD